MVALGIAIPIAAFVLGLVGLVASNMLIFRAWDAGDYPTLVIWGLLAAVNCFTVALNIWSLDRRWRWRRARLDWERIASDLSRRQRLGEGGSGPPPHG